MIFSFVYCLFPIYILLVEFHCTFSISYKILLHFKILSYQSPRLTTLAFRSREVRHLLLDLDPYGGTDTLGVFPLFLKRTADAIAPRLSSDSAACSSG